MDTDHDYRLVALACRQVGHAIRILPLEKCIGGKVESDQVVLTFSACLIRETARHWHVIKTGVRMLQYSRQADGTWKLSVLVVWDEEAEPYDIQHWGRKPLTRAERIKQGLWEQDCYRPGSSQSPMDSFDREAQGYAAGGVTSWRN